MKFDVTLWWKKSALRWFWIRLYYRLTAKTLRIDFGSAQKYFTPGDHAQASGGKQLQYLGRRRWRILPPKPSDYEQRLRERQEWYDHFKKTGRPPTRLHQL